MKEDLTTRSCACGCGCRFRVWPPDSPHTFACAFHAARTLRSHRATEAEKLAATLYFEKTKGQPRGPRRYNGLTKEMRKAARIRRMSTYYPHSDYSDEYWYAED